MTFTTARSRAHRYPEDRRRDVMDAAVHLFATRGLAATTVADIAAAAGMAKGSFYLAFSSKEELLAHLKQRYADELVARTRAHVERIGSEDLWALADAMVESMVHFHLEQRDVVHVMAVEGQGGTTSAYAEAGRTVQAMITAGIEAGVAGGAFACEDPFMTAGLLMHAIDGLLQHCILYGGDVDEARVVAAARSLVRKALTPD